MERVFWGAIRVLRALEKLGFPELVVWDRQSLSGGGCDTQLWTCAVPRALETLLQRYPTGSSLAEDPTSQDRES